MVLWMGNSGCARPIGGLVWLVGLVFGVGLAWRGGVAEWIGLALVGVLTSGTMGMPAAPVVVN